MEVQQEQSKPRVVTIDSMESWDSHLNQANLQTSPVIVHFTASWCMPSVAMNPIFDELASCYQNALFLLVDVDDLQEVARKMEITAMPTFMLMKNGCWVDKFVGANPEEIRKRIHTFVQSIA